MTNASASLSQTSFCSLWRRFTDSLFWREPVAKVGSLCLLVVVLFSLIGPLLYRASPDQTHPFDLLSGPSAKFPLGTDELGRNILARLLHAGLLSIPSGMLAVGIGAILGSLVGVTCGFVGGLLDNVIMRLVDVMLALPTLLTALVVVAILGPGTRSAIFAVSIAAFPAYARVLRGSALSLRTAQFVDAGRVSNTPLRRMIGRHVIPNVFDVLLVLIVIGIGNGIVILASFSFLGIGTQPPQADWGVMLADGVSNLSIAPLTVIAPAIVLITTVVGINLVGEGYGASRRIDTRRVQYAKETQT